MSERVSTYRWGIAVMGLLGLLVSGCTANVDPPAASATPVDPNQKQAQALGYDGAVSSVDPVATQVGLEVLRAGGNAVDAAVATAAALGVTEPYSTGIGGGGYFLYYDAESKTVTSIDGRETAPASIPNDPFIDPQTNEPFDFSPELVSSGVSVGVPGTPATWQSALDSWGTLNIAQALEPAIQIAEEGFEVDETFSSQTVDNAERFAAFSSTSELYLPDGEAPVVGDTFRNPELAATYRTLAEEGIGAFYQGPIADEIVSTVQAPPTVEGTELPAPVGFMEVSDLEGYETIQREPTNVEYRDFEVYGMAPSSSGGITVGEALNIMEQFDLSTLSDEEALRYYLDASALAFADRAEYIGDPDFVDVPTDILTSDSFAESRACRITGDSALVTPIDAGSLDAVDCPVNVPQSSSDQGTSTTHLVTSDQWGNVVSYTSTIEQTGGSAMVVPGRGFLLNNELTDFSLSYEEQDPNRVEGGKRPRSSMSPTIVLQNGEPLLALGSPGGSTIITTVLQTLMNRFDRGMSLTDAIAAPRASSRNQSAITAEPEFIEQYGAKLTELYGFEFNPSGDSFTSAAEIGASVGLEFRGDGLVEAVAEPVRRGGGDAGVVREQ